MINFEAPDIKHCEAFERALKGSGKMGSDACFGNIYMWCDAYSCAIGFLEDALIFRAGDSYTLPLRDGAVAFDIVDLLISEREKSGEILKFHCLSRENMDALKQRYGDKFRFEADRDSYDYIYSVSDLANLSGKKYHSKRNHISYFENTFDWSYEDMTSKNVGECLEFSEYWYLANKDKQETGTEREMNAIRKGLRKFDELKLVGGVLRVEREIVAYTFGEAIDDRLFCTHVEKASSDIRGAYPMINREFAKNTISKFELVNREEDLGIEGLRWAKESYKPTILLEKYLAFSQG